MRKRKTRPVETPEEKPVQPSPEDLARAIFRDADRKLAKKLSAK